MLASGFYLVVQLSFFRSIFYFSNNLDIYTQTWKLYIPQGNFDTDNMPIYGYQFFFTKTTQPVCRRRQGLVNDRVIRVLIGGLVNFSR